MKIVSLKIKLLYGQYDYSIMFNQDLTFLYGSNGCGKTTILNIIEAIVSGRIYNLFKWEFDRICLFYVDDEYDMENKKQIAISYENENLSIVLDEREKYKIDRDLFKRYYEETDSSDELYYLMDKHYPLLGKLRKQFNYVYLPLNRNSEFDFENQLYRKMNRHYSINYKYEMEERMVSREEQVGKAAKLVREKYSEATALVTSINNEFRNRVLKSSLGAKANMSDEAYIKFIIDTINNEEIDSVKEQYYRLLDSLDLLGETEKKEYDFFFESYKKLAERFIKSKEESGKSISIPVVLIYDFYQIEKMKTLIPLAQELEQKKNEALKHISLFKNIMNSFVQDNNAEKRLDIDDTGMIRFLDRNGKKISMSIMSMSSGEKQLLILFANLIFNVNENKSSIFVVDEPELSLHLSWQKLFVEKAKEVNPKMQFIFATHAPEIVGKYRDKMYKLEKKYHD